MILLRSHRLPGTALLGLAIMAAAVAPANAQVGPPPPAGGGWQGNWQGQWQTPDNRVYQGTWSGTYERGYPGGPMAQLDGPPSPPGGPGAWGPPRDERWQRMVDRCSTDHRNGKLVGGVIGGVVGGVVGNRLADGNRVLGTVAGAGVGALGGAAVGAAIDRGHDRECEDFFREAGPGEPGYAGGWSPQPGSPGWAAPAGYMWVPIMVQGGSSGRGYTEIVTTTEELVGGDDERRTIHRVAHRRTIRRAPPRRVVHDKRVYIGGS